MRVSAKGEYAILAVLDLALRRGQTLVPIQDIAERQAIPQRYLEQVLLSLKRAGLLGSRRGSSGGYHLTRPAEQISVGDVLRAVDGAQSPLEAQRRARGRNGGETFDLGELWDIAANVLERIGGTPMVRLNRLPAPGAARVVAKLESVNPGGSVKDRIALSMLEDAEARGLLKPGATIVEPTSGNTGIGLAMAAAVRGYRLILTMPDDMSVERQRLLARFGAELHVTPAIEGMTGAVHAAQELLREHPDYFMPQQFQNPANPEAHRRTTALEILDAVDGRLDAFVAGVGTGGTVTGVGEVLKEKVPGVRVIAVEPAKSPVLSGGKARPHAIQGIGASFVPGVLNRAVIDRIIQVRDEDALAWSRRLAREEGLLVGVSAGAAAFAACAVATELAAGQLVVTVLPDTGERYLSQG
ncbi:MAG: cysteine synthase A [Candidatus Rokuibacteriota bacterium]|nr:MAG: cysteine synthase A [Candidatus Rokubacteria bacterium]